MRCPTYKAPRGEAVPLLDGLRTFGNAVDRVSSAFSEGKQNEDLKEKLDLIKRRDIRFQERQKICIYFSMIKSFFILFTIN